MKIYLDNAATTVCYQEVADIVRETMLDAYGNPSSMHHKGVEAEAYIRNTTRILADILKVKAYIKGTGPLTAEEFAVADIDGDGNVTTTDYSLLARALAGWKGYAEQYKIPA